MPINPLEIVTAAALAKLTVDIGTDALKRIQAPILDHLGQKLRDRFLRRTDDLIVASTELLDGSGKTVADVPDRMLIPILQRNATNEDDEIAKKWARLLANAALLPDVTYPAYVDILSSLSPAEAAALDHFWKSIPIQEKTNSGGYSFNLNLNSETTKARVTPDSGIATEDSELPFAFGDFRVPPAQVLVFVSNFLRLGLWTLVVEVPMTKSTISNLIGRRISSIHMGDPRMGFVSAGNDVPPHSEWTKPYAFAVLGVGFMNACHPVRRDDL